MSHGVLIIEDETVLAKNIRLYLERSGFKHGVQLKLIQAGKP